jgi:hypothetical protein
LALLLFELEEAKPVLDDGNFLIDVFQLTQRFVVTYPFPHRLPFLIFLWVIRMGISFNTWQFVFLHNYYLLRDVKLSLDKLVGIHFEHEEQLTLHLQQAVEGGIEDLIAVGDVVFNITL